jgi:osmoprotectant transport system ATP-binding protein
MSDSPDTRPAIEFRNVCYRLGGNGDAARTLLHDLNLEVQRGETLVLLGRSGSGKTTTLKLINRLLTPSEGELRVDSRPIDEWDVIRLRRMIGYVIQDVGLFPHFTVERNIGLVPKIEKWPADRISKRVDELLQLVGLDPEIALRYPRELSGGQRQRVGVARALAADPPILLMDEPFGALDALTREQLQHELLQIWKRTGVTTIFVTHSVEEAVLLADRVLVMSAGPGRIDSDFQIDLVRPRDVSSPEFNALRRDIARRLTSHLAVSRVS